MREVFVMALLSVSVYVHAQTLSWIEAGNYHNISLYTLSVPGEQTKHFKGVVDINAPMIKVLAPILMRETMPEWFHNIRQAQTVKENNPDGSLAYFWIKGVWPTSDRDAVVRVSITQDPLNHAVSVTAKSTDPTLIPLYSDRIRMPKMESKFTVIPINASTCRVILEGSGDPGGTVPKSLVNAFMMDTPKYTLDALKRLVEAGTIPSITNLNNNTFANYALKQLYLP